MEMDRAKFAESMGDLSRAYNRPDMVNSGVAETWYKYLKDFSAEAFAATVSEYISHEPKAPSISDLIYRCKDMERKLKRECERRKERGDNGNV